MKIDTRKDCKRMTVQECFLRRNKAIPESKLMEQEKDNSEAHVLLGRQVSYEPYLIHSPVLASTRLQNKATTKVRLSKKYMHKLNDVIDSLRMDELTASIGSLAISSKGGDDNSNDKTSIASMTNASEPEREGISSSVPLVSATGKSDSESNSSGSKSDDEGEVPSSAADILIGRVQLKVIDEATNQEIVVSRCVRFMETEEAEI